MTILSFEESLRLDGVTIRPVDPNGQYAQEFKEDLSSRCHRLRWYPCPDCAEAGVRDGDVGTAKLAFQCLYDDYAEQSDTEIEWVGECGHTVRFRT